MAKRGRPPKSDGKVYQFRLRLTKEENDLLDTIAKEAGTTKSAVLLEGLKYVSEISLAQADIRTIGLRACLLAFALRS